MKPILTLLCLLPALLLLVLACAISAAGGERESEGLEGC